jgi:hypothetical protein
MFKTPNYCGGSEHAQQNGSWLLSCITTHRFQSNWTREPPNLFDIALWSAQGSPADEPQMN